MKMTDTMFNPPETLIDRLVPNRNKKGVLVWGKPIAGMAANNVDGRAGLFSTVSDLAKFCRMIINQGELDGVRILKKDTANRMVSQKLGWWYFEKNGQSVFHPGATGAIIYLNTQTKKYLIFLSNGLHSYFKKKKKFGSFVEGFAELADGQELGTIRKLQLISR